MSHYRLAFLVTFAGLANCVAEANPLLLGGSGAASASGGSSGSAGASGSSSAGSGSSLPGSGGTGINLNIDAGVGGIGGGGRQLATDVSVLITADNAYGFGYGTETEILNYFGGIENPGESDIFACPIGNGPEAYTVPSSDANAGNYLYIIGYADRSTTQGVIAKFVRDGGEPVFTGQGEWEACATGEDYDPGSGGPSVARINEFIELCNAGDLDGNASSGGWVDGTGTDGGRVVFGEDNSTPRAYAYEGNEFDVACEIDPGAHWMWFDWNPGRTAGNAFMWPGGEGNPTKDFVIFRLGAEYIPEPPPH